MQKKYKNFQEFWPFYVQEHKHPLNRKLHFLGTGLALGCATLAASRRRPRLFLLAPLLGYFFAWMGHFVVEKNRPATFKYPLFSLRGDFKMFGMMATGRMNEEIQRILLEAESEADSATQAEQLQTEEFDEWADLDALEEDAEDLPDYV
ncbi:DUF962 domain-containing protein [bacterium (Candidatus Blackallbacteria) CG17_big_fil_post_rev_8_21_14_2_50_48_46]|uniref:DUF962 domain-containing protein n=1 Tax=bacterium (Candidatus Blackallbacteria) CG17_big_fil_post_rev_8_21_14_2_50_48_46 TaxID=2014261 RepID=A0A2M7G1T2_9BACT|nr:MAG: hypothetical protein COW64_16660 [bacterium (Candidatus Blackallbacteria) CG18_big_fil_WC_8_21_14_2_50_49_26]PIW15704.1 MAG: DUF962 domain-containing protein [bacterium (Candidatus Blackallbacteria) CG17_big_fil_post_rev_8_21_14_2_50_48_46]PIW48711.1 MAG: DUF962 domain-containing protein [bacterium (Candidatus Blackallbacteria) CG13_big_fil_rev_8_21_14_2_50_49_14]